MAKCNQLTSLPFKELTLKTETREAFLLSEKTRWSTAWNTHGEATRGSLLSRKHLVYARNSHRYHNYIHFSVSSK